MLSKPRRRSDIFKYLAHAGTSVQTYLAPESVAF